MSEERAQLARGFAWLGSATALARIIDALAMVLVLRFLSREQIGVATLAWSVAVFVECFNGLGIGTATLQQPALSRTQISSAFWYAAAIAVGLVLTVVLAAPWIAQIYRAPDLTPMIRVASLKLVFVGLAAVPLALLAREMRFRALGAITSAATLVSGVVTLALAAGGAGAWAPLLGNVSHGLAQLVGAYLMCETFPKHGFDWSALRGMARTGLNISGSVAVVQLGRNIDYLLLGRLVSTEALGGYRVAFDLAMAPSIALLQVGNRTALPVYSRLGSQPGKLSEAWLWTVRTVTVMTVPIMALVFVDGERILLLLGKSGWPNAGHAIRLLTFAAFMRGIAETIPSVYVAAGRSSLSFVHAVSNFALVGASMLLGFSLFAASDPILVICVAWIVATFSLVVLSLAISRRAVSLSTPALFKALLGPCLVFALVTGTLFVLQPLLPSQAGMALAVDAAMVVLTYVVALRLVMGVDVRTLLSPPPSTSSA